MRSPSVKCALTALSFRKMRTSRFTVSAHQGQVQGSAWSGQGLRLAGDGDYRITADDVHTYDGG